MATQLESFSKRLMMPTEVAHIVIFHPDDLQHCAGWPIAWYADSFVFPHESAAGRLIAWSTRMDGGFAVRLTDGDLCPREKLYTGGSWVFPFTVRHGRVYLDNTDALPGVEQMSQTSDHEDYWIDVPNGDYAVTVTGVQWDAEPGAEAEGFAALPNYVVQFQPVESTKFVIGKRPPDIESLIGQIASDVLYEDETESVEVTAPTRLLPAFASQNVQPAGLRFKSKGEAPLDAAVKSEEGFDIFEQSFVVVTRTSDMVPGALAMICDIRGISQAQGEAKSYEMLSQKAVRIQSVDGMFRKGMAQPILKKGIPGIRKEFLPSDSLTAVTVAEIKTEADSDVPLRLDFASIVAEIQQSLLHGGVLAELLGLVANYEALHVSSLHLKDELSTWMLTHLPAPVDDRLRWSILPSNKRFQVLVEHFRAINKRKT